MAIIGQGPNNAGTFATDNTLGNVDWTNPSNASAEDDSYATCVFVGSSDSSYYLVATNFGFTLPSGAEVAGIVAEVNRYNSLAAVADVTDSNVKLYINGALDSSGQDKSTSLVWPSSDDDSYQEYGGVTDQWGHELPALTDTDVNATNFGVAIRCENTGAMDVGLPNVDHIRLTIFYKNDNIKDVQMQTLEASRLDLYSQPIV